MVMVLLLCPYLALRRNLILGVIFEKDVILALLKLYLKHHRHVEFVIGDMVYLKLCPYRQHTIVHWFCQKLRTKFYCPY